MSLNEMAIFFFIRKWPLFLTLFFAQKSALSYIDLAIPTFFPLVSA